MLDKVDGSITLYKFEHSLKAPSSIFVTEMEISFFVNELHLLNVFLLINFNKGEKIDICSNAEQLLKAFSPIDSTNGGIKILINEQHPSKAPFPIDVTLDGILMYFSDVHNANALFSIDLIDKE